MALSGLNNLVPLIACEIFAIIIHFLYLVFFTWTGRSGYDNKNFEIKINLFSVIEGYFFYRALVVVFNTRTLSTIVYYVIGYGLPTVIVIVLVLINVITGVEMYLRRNTEAEVEICFLSVEAMPAIVVPAGETLLFYDGHCPALSPLQAWSLFSIWPSPSRQSVQLTRPGSEGEERFINIMTWILLLSGI